MCRDEWKSNGSTHLLVIKLSRFSSPRIHELNLTSREAHEKRRALARRRRLIEVMAARVGALVELFINWFA